MCRDTTPGTTERLLLLGKFRHNAAAVVESVFAVRRVFQNRSCFPHSIKNNKNHLPLERSTVDCCYNIYSRCTVCLLGCYVAHQGGLDTVPVLWYPDGSIHQRASYLSSSVAWSIEEKQRDDAQISSSYDRMTALAAWHKLSHGSLRIEGLNAAHAIVFMLKTR